LARGQRLGMRATDQWATLLAIVRGGVTALSGDANFLKLVYAAFEQPGDRGSHLLRDHGGNSRLFAAGHRRKPHD
jgi:hypothetical protein